MEAVLKRLDLFRGSGGLSDRQFHVLISSAILLALILRTAALLSLEKSPYFGFLLLDEAVYHGWALKLAAGTYHASSVYEFSPLPAYVMALVYKLFSADVFYVRILNIGLGVHTCYLIYLIGEELSNRLTGLIACFTAALYKPFILYSIVPLKTAMSVFLFALTIHLLLTVLSRPSRTKSLLLGIAAGLLLNVRPNFLVIVPLMFIILLLNPYGKVHSLRAPAMSLLVVFLGFVLSVAPFVVRNYRVSGEFALTTSQRGFNLYQGNDPASKVPYCRPVPFAICSPLEQGVHFTIEASRRANRKLSPGEASSFWTREVIRTASAHPGPFLVRLFQKTLAVFNRFDAGDHYHIGFVSHSARFFSLPLLSFWLVLPFGMAGMVTGAAHSAKVRAIMAVFLVYALTLIAFHPNPRYRQPLLVVLIPLAATGLIHLLRSLKERHGYRVLTYSALTAAFFIIEFLPVRGTDDLSSYYNNYGIILNSKGWKEEALRSWERASRMYDSASANLSLAGEYFRRRKMAKAIGYLQKIPDHSFAAAPRNERMGDILMQMGRVEEAVAAYRKALVINSGLRSPRMKLIRIYKTTDPKQALEQEKIYRYISMFYDNA